MSKDLKGNNMEAKECEGWGLGGSETSLNMTLYRFEF